jgi:hypothetical protein
VTVQIEIAETLAGTREFIEEHGWTQDEMVDQTTGRVCMVGGMYSHLDLDGINVYDPRILAACRALTKMLGISPHSPEVCTRDSQCTCVVNWVTTWNDEPERTVQEVLDALAKAEKIERMGYDPDLGYSE